MKKQLYGMVSRGCAGEGKVRLEYYLIESETNGQAVFGAEIRRFAAGQDDAASAADIWTDRHSGELFIELLAEYKAEPEHLQDLAEDFAGRDLSEKLLREIA